MALRVPLTPEEREAQRLSRAGHISADKEKDLADQFTADPTSLASARASLDNVERYDQAIHAASMRPGMAKLADLFDKRARDHNKLAKLASQHDHLKEEEAQLERKLTRANKDKDRLDRRVAGLSKWLTDQETNYYASQRKWYNVFGAIRFTWVPHKLTQLVGGAVLKTQQRALDQKQTKVSKLNSDVQDTRDMLSQSGEAIENTVQTYADANKQMEEAWETIQDFMEVAPGSALEAAILSRDVNAIMREMHLNTFAGKSFRKVTGRAGVANANLPSWVRPGSVSTAKEAKILAEALRSFAEAQSQVEMYRHNAMAIGRINGQKTVTRNKIDAILKNDTQKRAQMENADNFFTAAGDWSTRLVPETDELLAENSRTAEQIRVPYIAGKTILYRLPDGNTTTSMADAINKHQEKQRATLRATELIAGMPLGWIDRDIKAQMDPLLGSRFTYHAELHPVQTTTPPDPSKVLGIRLQWENTATHHKGAIIVPLANIPGDYTTTFSPAYQIDYFAWAPSLEQQLRASMGKAVQTDALLAPLTGGHAVAVRTKNAVNAALGAGATTSVTVDTYGTPTSIRKLTLKTVMNGSKLEFEQTITDMNRIPLTGTPPVIDIAALPAALDSEIKFLRARLEEDTYLSAHSVPVTANLKAAVDADDFLKKGAPNTITYVAAAGAAKAHFTWDMSSYGGVTLLGWTQSIDPKNLVYTRAGTPPAISAVNYAKTLGVMKASLANMEKTLKDVPRLVKQELVNRGDRVAEVKLMYSPSINAYGLSIIKRGGGTFPVPLSPLELTFNATTGVWTPNLTALLTSIPRVI